MDQFVAECRKQVQLEEMREDLELYYKLLKTAMVELINKDYADFVNLSTNLVSQCKRRQMQTSLYVHKKLFYQYTFSNRTFVTCTATKPMTDFTL